jgi:hypothetical protein
MTRLNGQICVHILICGWCPLYVVPQAIHGRVARRLSRPSRRPTADNLRSATIRVCTYGFHFQGGTVATSADFVRTRTGCTAAVSTARTRIKAPQPMVLVYTYENLAQMGSFIWRSLMCPNTKGFNFQPSNGRDPQAPAPASEIRGALSLHFTSLLLVRCC